MSRAIILSGARTAIGGYGGSLKEILLPELGRVDIEAAIERAEVEANEVHEVILGKASQ